MSFLYLLISPSIGASLASRTTLTFCQSPAVCIEAVCQALEDPAQPERNASAERSEYDQMKRLCPPDRDDIGRAMWTVLHSIAAYYPQNATEDQERKARDFVFALPELYPCKDCARHLASALEEMPPRLETRKGFSVWLCDLHNRVNVRTGKLPRPCTLRELDEAWRTPSQACIAARKRLRAVTTRAESDRDML
jgi:FAD-linked sulfhydryl oxidase